MGGGIDIANGGKRKKSLWGNLGFQVVISMILGALVGFIYPESADTLKILGDIFLRLIKTAIAPLVFLTIVMGIASAGDFRRVGKVGLVALIYFEIVSTIAIVFGLAFAYLLGVGYGGVANVATSEAATKAALAAADKAHAADSSFSHFFVKIFPENFVGAFSGGELLQVVVIAIIFGAAMLMLQPAKRSPIERGLASISHVFFEFINLIMRLAPIGTFGAVAYAVGSNGIDVLIALGWLVLAFYIAVIAFVFIVLGGICFFFKINLLGLLRYIKEEIIVVLGTASSESVLPKLLEKLPGYGAAKETVGLVLPTGYAFNLDGSSMFMSLAVVFISHAYHVPLSFDQIVGLLIIIMLTSKGAATVSGGAFVVLAAVVTATSYLPVDALVLIFGVYRFMSIAVATCNVIGNCVATIVTSHICGDFDPVQAERANRDPKGVENEIMGSTVGTK